MFEIRKIYNKRAMAYCPKHVSQSGRADLDITLEGSYAGKFYCYGCGYCGCITDAELQELRQQRGKFQKATTEENYDKLNLEYMGRRREILSFPPHNFSLASLAKVQWGHDGSASTFPMRDGQNGITGIHRQWPNGNKGMRGHLGLFIPVIQFDKTKPLYITEGLSDLLCILECGLQGIGRPNAKSCVKEIVVWERIHKIPVVYVVADNDKPGRVGAAQLIDNLNSVSKEIGLTQGTELLIPKYSDLREMFDTVGLRETKAWLVTG